MAEGVRVQFQYYNSTWNPYQMSGLILHQQKWTMSNSLCKILFVSVKEYKVSPHCVQRVYNLTRFPLKSFCGGQIKNNKIVPVYPCLIEPLCNPLILSMGRRNTVSLDPFGSKQCPRFYLNEAAFNQQIMAKVTGYHFHLINQLKTNSGLLH